MKLILLVALPLFVATEAQRGLPCVTDTDCGVSADPCCDIGCNMGAGVCIEVCSFCGACFAPDCPVSAPGCVASCDKDDLCTETCPEEPNPSGTCKSSAECGKDQYCADGMCLDDGMCSVNTDCVNPNNDLGDSVKDCDGFLVCNAKDKCTKRCRSSGCPVQKPPVQCLVDPCEAKKGECPEAAECVSNFCGGCNAIFFDAAGKRVCKEGNTDSQQKCKRSSECGPGKFCGKSGFCLQKGQCTKRGDCLNRNNQVPPNPCKRRRVRNKRNGKLVYRRSLRNLSCKRFECKWSCW